MTFVYVLLLEDNKYYIGKTNSIEIRLQAHFNERGSEWTKKYKPKSVVEKIETSDPGDEDKYTIKYMQEFGTDNVRGGSFCKIELDPAEKSVLDIMIKSRKDTCFKCGKEGHFSKDCNIEIQKFVEKFSSKNQMQGTINEWQTNIIPCIEDLLEKLDKTMYFKRFNSKSSEWEKLIIGPKKEKYHEDNTEFIIGHVLKYPVTRDACFLKLKGERFDREVVSEIKSKIPIKVILYNMYTCRLNYEKQLRRILPEEIREEELDQDKILKYYYDRIEALYDYIYDI